MEAAVRYSGRIGGKRPVDPIASTERAEPTTTSSPLWMSALIVGVINFLAQGLAFAAIVVAVQLIATTGLQYGILAVQRHRASLGLSAFQTLPALRFTRYAVFIVTASLFLWVR